ncbi:MAG: S8 family serine peptidase [Gemmatimonadales bacterium]|nr:S8 family serine peptidase [Gemmatimonadales bacterium]
MRYTIALSFLALLCASSTDLSAQVERRPFLFKDSRGELAQARARGESDVLLVIAAQVGQNAQVANVIAQAGGVIQFRSDDVDYIRARVPIDGVEGVVTHSSVHSVDISIHRRSRAFSRADREPADVPTSPLPSNARLVSDTIIEAWPPVLGDYPLRNRYSPLHDVRAVEFREANPTYDGRGVKIAMIDMNPDMLLPELQQAMTIDGEPIPKIAGYGTALDVDEEDDGRWVRMDDIVDVASTDFTFGDETYTAPRAGTFRVAHFNEVTADTAGTYGSQGLDRDVNRDGNPEASSRLFAVLWDETSDEVWVDTDQDLSFTNEKALTDHAVRPEFGVFGTDDPDTPIRESIGFGVQIDQDRKLVALNLGIASHASLVVGAAVGSRGESGKFDGMAPGAQLISISEGGSAYGQTESTILSVIDHGADVVYFEQSSNITRTYLLRDGRLVPTVIYERLVENFGASILSPTHNYPILGGIDDFVLAKGVIGVNGHESKENFFINHGVRVEHEDNLLITGGYGPMGNGALQPDIISPSNYVSTALGFIEGRAIPGLYQLPPGYTIAGGTSTATPTAAGSVAMLISAAKQEGVGYDPYRLKYAVTRGARWVPHLRANTQGNGVISVAGAWDILKRLDAGGQMIEIEGRAPVRHPYSHMLATPHEGVGLYERDGWNVGDRGQRMITLTRTSGPSGPMTFTVNWAGNDHRTFSAPSTVTLPLNQSVDVPITIAPTQHGAHTAHFTLDHPDVPGYAYRTLATIVAAETLNAENGFTMKNETEVPRPGIESFFYNVPEGVTALKVDLTWEDREVSLAVSRPDTRSAGGERITTDSGVSQMINGPAAGVWEVRLTDVADTRTFDWEQAKKLEPVPPTPATVTITALSAGVSVMAHGGSVDTSGSDTEGTTYDLWITNPMAKFDGGAVNTPLGSARAETHEITEKEQHVFEIEVLPGSTGLIARAFDATDSDADLDVYVFDCTGDECTPARTDADPEGDESEFVSAPAAGTWKIVVDASNVPSGSTSYQYLDVVFNPSYGTVSVADIPQERAEGSRWMAKAHTWTAGMTHDPGRRPYAALVVEGRTTGGETFLVNLLELATAPALVSQDRQSGGR